ncbi:MAG: hypothetical protein JST30_00350 [Armatimonadetes bacterium]|nr:hypothetical protein [Armatimonadota bacterium]
MTAVLVSTLVLAFQSKSATVVKTVDLAKFDKKTVTVVGTVEKYEERTSKTSKKPYTLFVVKDASGKVNVYLRNRPDVKLKDGTKVSVTGVYTKEKKVGQQTFKNEIDASNDKVKTNGVKLVKK